MNDNSMRCRRLLCLDPGSHETLFRLGEALIAAGKPKHAEIALHRALARSPALDGPLVLLARAAQSAEAWFVAESRWRRVLAREPGSFEAALRLTQISFKQELLDR